ncbi:ABC-three component system middle component 6 [Photobacterium iliopiscarium]
MRAHQFNSICPTILYRKYCRKIKNISYSYFINGLDWLYLIKVIELKDNGDITLCN